MKLYFWQGGETNLGRFGTVNKGALLCMTEAEAEYVEKHKDKNFRRAKGNEIVAAAAPDSLKKANDPAVIGALELRQANHDNLLARCERMKAAGIPIDFKVRSSRTELIAAICMAERNTPAQPPII